MFWLFFARDLFPLRERDGYWEVRLSRCTLCTMSNYFAHIFLRFSPGKIRFDWNRNHASQSSWISLSFKLYSQTVFHFNDTLIWQILLIIQLSEVFNGFEWAYAIKNSLIQDYCSKGLQKHLCTSLTVVPTFQDRRNSLTFPVFFPFFQYILNVF